MLKFKPRQILILSLVLVTLGTWTYLLLPTANYAYYYKALEDLTIQIPKFTTTNTSSAVTVLITFNVSNPTPYVGLTLASISFQAFIPNGTIDEVMGSSGAGPPVPVSLRPFSYETLQGRLVLTGGKMAQYETFAAKGPPEWHVGGTIALWSRGGFLSPGFCQIIGENGPERACQNPVAGLGGAS
jgi:hypothetical protein